MTDVSRLCWPKRTVVRHEAFMLFFPILMYTFHLPYHRSLTSCIRLFPISQTSLLKHPQAPFSIPHRLIHTLPANWAGQALRNCLSIVIGTYWLISSNCWSGDVHPIIHVSAFRHAVSVQRWQALCRHFPELNDSMLSAESWTTVLSCWCRSLPLQALW